MHGVGGELSQVRFLSLWTSRTNTWPKIVIIDEAGVAKETEALWAIVHNLIVFTYEIDHDSTEAATVGFQSMMLTNLSIHFGRSYQNVQRTRWSQ